MKRLFGMAVLLTSLPGYAHGISEADKHAMLDGGLTL
jgi:hypothetical protein